MLLRFDGRLLSLTLQHVNVTVAAWMFVSPVAGHTEMLHVLIISIMWLTLQVMWLRLKTNWPRQRVVAPERALWCCCPLALFKSSLSLFSSIFIITVDCSRKTPPENVQICCWQRVLSSTSSREDWRGSYAKKKMFTHLFVSSWTVKHKNTMETVSIYLLPPGAVGRVSFEWMC